MNKVQHIAASDTSSGPSPSIWASMNRDIVWDPAIGHHFFDDFVSGFDSSGTSLTLFGPYETLADSGASMAAGADATATVAEGLSVQTLVAGTTADADCTMQVGAGASFAISDTAADAKKLWFEARFKISTIADDVSSFFIGLAAAARCADKGVFQAGQGATVDSALADAAMIGFWRPDADGDGLSAAYHANGQTASEIISDAHTLVADTYVKAGFVYDPDFDAAQRIKFYINGTEQTTYITSTLIAAAAFPDAEAMSPVVGIMNDDGSTASTLTLDWWRCAQLR